MRSNTELIKSLENNLSKYPLTKGFFFGRLKKRARSAGWVEDNYVAQIILLNSQDMLAGIEYSLQRVSSAHQFALSTLCGRLNDLGDVVFDQEVDQAWAEVKALAHFLDIGFENLEVVSNKKKGIKADISGEKDGRKYLIEVKSIASHKYLDEFLLSRINALHLKEPEKFRGEIRFAAFHPLDELKPKDKEEVTALLKEFKSKFVNLAKQGSKLVREWEEDERKRRVELEVRRGTNFEVVDVTSEWALRLL